MIILITMQNQELLLLQILKFPVIIIKFLAKLLSILTYLPNYAVILLIDLVLFRQLLYATRIIYVITWLPKVALLAVVIALFGCQFHIIFSIMQLYDHGLAIQSIGMILTLVSLIILMRKGYLLLLKKYNLTKLKSPLEHAGLLVAFFIDFVGMVLWVVNLALIINVSRSWDYQYDLQKNFQFIKHNFNLVRESMISYIEFFYVKIFFKLFPWRFIRQIETYQKQKEGKNVLNCLVLLTLIYLTTLLDLIVVVLFGLPCLIHPQRKNYINHMKQNHQKYRITLKQFGFVLVHLLQMIIICLCTIFCWKNGIKALKRWNQHTKTDQLFNKELGQLVIETIFKIPYLVTSLLILASVYKYKRKLYLLNKSNNQNQANPQKKDQNQQIWITFKCFSQLLLDLCFLVLIIISTIIKPWNIWWLGFLLNQQYVMNHNLISSYFMKNLSQIIFLPFALLTTILIFLYQFRRPYNLLEQSGVQVQNQYDMVAGNNNAAPDHLKHRFFILQGKSQIIRYFAKTCFQLKSDIPHLLLFFITKMTFLDLYFPAIKPQTTPQLFIMLQRSYFYLSAKRSIRFNQYQQMFDRIKASGGLTSTKEQYRFWKYAYKSERLILIQKIISFLLPKKSVERIKARIQMGTLYSQISNYYWYHQGFTKAMVIRFVYLVIEAIITLIGVLFFLPLTLWRIPTFIRLYLYHRAKKFFFPILLKVYKQMFKDLILLPVKIICFLLAPFAYFKFVKNTSFKYGPIGIQTFQVYQVSKYNYLIRNILKTSFASLTIYLKVVFICILWIRIKSLKIFLRSGKLTIYTLYTEILLAKINVPTMQEMITQSYIGNYQKIEIISNFISDIFNDACQDLPYFLLMLFIFLTMPWRINYIIQTIKDMRQDTTQRKSFFKLLKNIFKDYACIFMNIVLLLSGFKTKKALFLIRRNYRLNFFIGFLKYSYFQQLLNQMRSLGVNYKNIFFMIVAVLFGWTRTDVLVNEMLALKKKKNQEQQSAASNKKLYEDTVKSGKQLQTLHKMGFYNYLTVSSFLTVPEIITLRQVDQFNYMMTKRQQIWFMKWQFIYSKISNEVSESFEAKCKNAFIMLKNQNGGQIVTYQQIIMKHFRENVFEKSVDIAEFLRERIPVRYYNIFFRNYTYSIAEGYGPENQLPQEENQDEQFLRLTNQVRRPIVDLTENQAWFHLFYVRISEKLAQQIHIFYRQDTHRRLKQFSFIVGVLAIVTTYLLNIWILRQYVFCIDYLIGVKIVFAIYFHTFVTLIFHRCSYLWFGWVSLRPFDLYYDFIRIKNYLIQQTKIKVIIPTKLFLIKCWNKFKQIWLIIQRKLRQKGIQIYQKIRIFGLKIKSGAKKVRDLTVKYSLLAYEKVVKPLYISIADKIRKMIRLIVYLFTVVIKSIKSFLQFIGRLITSFYQAIKSVISHINNLYFFVLKSSMQFLLKFGMIGNLIFTLFGLFIMTIPSLIWLTFYRQRWYLIVSTIHTIVLIVIGYKHLNKIKSGNQ